MAGVRRPSANESRREAKAHSGRGRVSALPRSKWVAAALVGPAALAATALSGSGNLATISSALADPLSIFAERSPGARAAGALTQSKPARKAAPQSEWPPALSPRRNTPTQGAGAEIGSGVPPAFEAIDLGQPGEETGAEGVEFAPFETGPFARGGTGSGFAIDGLGGGAIGGGAGLVPPSPPGGVPQPDPTNPVSAVPEPQTWLMMMVGFFLLGTTLRSRRRGHGTPATGSTMAEARLARAETQSLR